jgi:citrate lyase subunit beta/citryl-CoA lyase
VPADMSFLDLEDSVAPLEKEAARAKVADAIKNLPWDDRVLCVRINAWDTEWTSSCCPRCSRRPRWWHSISS